MVDSLQADRVSGWLGAEPWWWPCMLLGYHDLLEKEGELLQSLNGWNPIGEGGATIRHLSVCHVNLKARECLLKRDLT